MKTVLLIVDHVPLLDFEAAITERLQGRLGVTVQSKPSDSAIGSDAVDKDLIIICSRTASRELRRAPIPIAICQTEALYDLGMTLATPDVDFGTASGVTSVNIKSAGHPFNLGISGLQQVSQGGTGIAWAKPSSDAVIAATIPGTADRAVLFGYDLGAKMAALAAPHRRVAVLISGAVASTLTENGWQLFDSAITWALYGGPTIPQSIPTEGGFWYIEGKPTKVLSIEEYRNWVEDKVVRRMWAIISIIGLAGILAIGSLAYTTIGNLVKENVNSNITRLQKDLDANLDKRVGSHLAEILVDKAEIKTQLDQRARDSVAANMDIAKIGELTRQAIEKQATPEMIKNLVANAVTRELDPQRIQQLLDRAFDDPKENAKLVDAAVKQLTGTGKFNEILTAELIPIVNDQNQELSEREQALRFLLLFDHDQEELRSELLKVITNSETTSQELCSIALISFSPSKDASQDRNAIGTVLNRIRQDPTPSESLRKSYVQCLSRFPSTNARLLTAWLRTTDDRDARRLVVDGLIAMQGDEPITQLAELVSDKDTRLRELGFQALTHIDQNRSIEETSRRRALEKTWSTILDSIRRGREDTSDMLASYLGQVITASKADDLQGLRKLLLQSQDLPERLKSWNEKFINAIDSNDRAELSHLTRIYGLDAFADYVGRDATNGPRRQKIDAVAKLLRNTDWPILLSSAFWPNDSAESPEGRAAVEALLSSWVERLKSEQLTLDQSAKTADDLVDKILTLRSCLYSLPLADALTFGISHCSSDHYGQIISKFIDLYRDKLSKETAARFFGSGALREALKRDSTADDKYGATKAFVNDSVNQLKELTDISANGIDVAVDVANKEIASKKDRVDQIRRAWSEFFANVPDIETILDVIETRIQELQGDRLVYAYRSVAPILAKLYLQQGDASRIDKAWDKSVGQYTKCIQLNPLSFDAYKVRALAYVGLADDAHAEADMNKAISLARERGTQRELADCMENLGIIYLRKGDWKSAFDNSYTVMQITDKTAWNWVFRMIAADKLRLSDEVKTARDKLSSSEDSLEEEMLSSYLPAELNSYIEEAANIKQRTR